jgi:hypothetical protein
VATMTFEVSMMRPAAAALSMPFVILATNGRASSMGIAPAAGKTRSVENFPAIWLRRTELGTSTSILRSRL